MELNNYSQSVRYELAKGQIDQLFQKWISLSTTETLITRLISELESGKPGQALMAPPSPLFITKMQKAPNSPT